MGEYSVTLVTHEREMLFGEIVNGEMRLNKYGRIEKEEWVRTAVIHPYVGTLEDEFVVMPNHLHGIIRIFDELRLLKMLMGLKNFGIQAAVRATCRKRMMDP